MARKSDMDKQYIVTVKDVGNVTDSARNIHTILTSKDMILPRERVSVVHCATPLLGAGYNPSYTTALEETIRECVQNVEAAGAVVIAMLPVKKYPEGTNTWEWDGFILIESDGDQIEFDKNGNGVRATSAFMVPR